VLIPTHSCHLESTARLKSFAYFRLALRVHDEQTEIARGDSRRDCCVQGGTVYRGQQIVDHV